MTWGRRIENVNQVHVGTEIKFARPELAHRENAESPGLVRAFASQAQRRAESGTDAFIGQARHQNHGEIDIDSAGQVGDRNPEKITTLELRELTSCIGAGADGV